MQRLRSVMIDINTKGKIVRPLDDGYIITYSVTRSLQVGDLLPNGHTVLYIQDCDPGGRRRWAVTAYKSNRPQVTNLDEVTKCVD